MLWSRRLREEGLVRWGDSGEVRSVRVDIEAEKCGLLVCFACRGLDAGNQTACRTQITIGHRFRRLGRVARMSQGTPPPSQRLPCSILPNTHPKHPILPLSIRFSNSSTLPSKSSNLALTSPSTFLCSIIISIVIASTLRSCSSTRASRATRRCCTCLRLDRMGLVKEMGMLVKEG